MSTDTLRVLAIGNSFSCDAMAYLDELLLECGIKNVVLGNLYIGSCSLEHHWRNAETDAAVYSYFKSSPRLHVMRLQKSKCRMSQAILDENWDIITFQQSSAFLGFSKSYEPYLTNLIAYVKGISKNPEMRLVWHMTWAFADGCRHKVFERYSRSSEKMYISAVRCVQDCILSHSEIDFVIPCGTAIQNARTGALASGLSRDGRHLSLRTGRYVCSLMWASLLTEADLSKVSCKGILPGEEDAALKAVLSAKAEPFAVTDCFSQTDVRAYGRIVRLIDSAKAAAERHFRMKK